MKSLFRLALVVLGLVFASSLMAQTITPQIGGGIGFTFDGGISGQGTSSAPAPCPSPTAPDGSIDLSQCSNAFYVAVILY